MAITAKIGKRKTWTVKVGAYNGGTKDHSKLFNRDADNQHPMSAISGLKTFAENTNTHMNSKENPHGVTAAQVGARPNTWMPTAAQVGAAPAGYGLGDMLALTTPIADVHGVTKTGWYYVKTGTTANAPASGLLRAEVYAYALIKLTLYTNELTPDSTNVTLNKTCDGGGWGEWEWVNPPMVAGTEYRTTERWNGKAVYTALVSMGNLPNATTKAVSVPGDKVATNIVRFNAIATLSGKFAYDMMCLSGVTRVEFRYGTDSNVYMNIATNTDMSAYSGTFQLWYTKD